MFNYEAVSPQEVYYTDKLGYTEAAMDALRQAIQTPGRHLAVAPTGCGKTYSTISIFKQLSDDDICVIAVPTRSQAQQVAAEYNITALIGDGQKLAKMMAEDGPTVIVAVYDKVISLLDYISINMHLVVDEAQQLICARDYRSEAIQGLESVENEIVSSGGSVVHLTATMHPLFSYEYSSIISFIDANAKPKANETVMLINRSDKNALDFFFNRLITLDGRAIVRLNNKNYCRILKQYLTAAGRSCEIISSEDKEMAVSNDGLLRFKNDAMESIVHLSKIPDNVDYILTTSILDAGINIVGNDTSYNAIFCVADQHDADTVAMEQFFARLRFVHDRNLILYHPCKNAEEKNQYHLSISTLATRMNTELTSRIDALAAERDANLAHFDTSRLLKSMQHRLLFKDGEFTSDYFGCIYVSKENDQIHVNADKHLFAKRIYDRWMLGFYSHPNEIAEALADALLMPVCIENVTDEELRGSLKVDGNIIFEADKAVLKRIVDAKKLHLIESKDTSDSDINAFLSSSLCKWYDRFIHLKIDATETTNMLLSAESINDIQSAYDARVIPFLSSLNGSEAKLVSAAFRDPSILLIEQKKHPQLCQAMRDILSTSKYASPIRELIMRGMFLCRILHLKSIVSADELRKYVEKDQFVSNNESYVNGEDIGGTPFGRRQKVVLDFITSECAWIMEDKKSIRRHRLTDARVDQLVCLLNGLNDGKEYTPRMAKNLVLKVFACRKIESKKGKVILEPFSLLTV